MWHFVLVDQTFCMLLDGGAGQGLWDRKGKPTLGLGVSCEDELLLLPAQKRFSIINLPLVSSWSSLVIGSLRGVAVCLCGWQLECLAASVVRSALLSCTPCSWAQE